MKLVEIDINRIDFNNYNPNSMTPTEYRNTIYSLKKFGQVIPILVREPIDNRYIVIDGEHRVKGMRELEYTKC